MKNCQAFYRFLTRTLALSALVGGTWLGAAIPASLDSFDEAAVTALGTPRLVFNDKDLGGTSTAKQEFSDGVMSVAGKIVPGRGQPGFISLVLLLSPQGQPQDLSEYEGIRLRVKVTKGNLSVVAASSEIQNFDYHTTALSRTGGEFKEVRIPFAEMKRVWSEQRSLNLETITSINLVAAGVQPGDYAYEVDEVGFY